LSGPEQVFRVRITRPVSNFGVVVLTRANGVIVTPRIVAAGDENRLQGTAALPIATNPYLFTYGRLEAVAGVLRPAPGLYDIVFDTPSAARAGAFTFRFWIDDVAPPVLRLVNPVVRDGRLQIAVVDPGSGLDPSAMQVLLDGQIGGASYVAATNRIVVPLGSTQAGTHRVEVRASDYQEAKNNEDVTAILPNTRVFRATFRVAR
jgi:hypothetical protein